MYCQNEPISDAKLKLMRRIAELRLKPPFAGARMLRDLLQAEGFTLGRKHMSTLMRPWGSRRCTASRTRVDEHRDTQSIGTCCVDYWLMEGHSVWSESK